MRPIEEAWGDYLRQMNIDHTELLKALKGEKEPMDAQGREAVNEHREWPRDAGTTGRR